jgi:small subunit ribosomal protein S6
MSEEAGAATEQADTATEQEEATTQKPQKQVEARKPVLPQLDPETMRTTRLYELCLLFDPAEATRTWDKLIDWLKGLIEEKYEQHVLRVDKWADSRKLAYEIKGLKRGTYMVVWFRAKPGVVADIDRDLRLDERCARHLIIYHEEEPPTVGKSAEDFEGSALARREERRHDRHDRSSDRRGDRRDRDRRPPRGETTRRRDEDRPGKE